MMDKFIKVYDNILHPNLVNQIEELLLSGTNPHFKFNYIPNVGTRLSNEYNPGFSHVFGGRTNNMESPFDYMLFNILYNFCNTQNIEILDVIAARAFLMVPPPKPSLSVIHTDVGNPHWVCLYYVNNSDGDTVFFEDDEVTEIKRVSPKKGRIVFFNGLIKHAATFPSLNPRSVVNFGFIGEYLDK